MVKTLGLAHLINSLLSEGGRRAATTKPAVPESAGTTLRFDPELRAFLDTHANTLGLSLASVVTMILKGVMQTTQSETAGTAFADKMQLMAQRFRLLMEDHRIDIPTTLELFKKDGINSAILGDPTALVDKLDSQLIDRISDQFSINRMWLRGEDDYPGRRVDDWYKMTAGFCLHVAKIARQYREPEVIFVRPKSADFASAYRLGDEAPAQNVTPVIKKKLRLENGQTIELYELWQTERWNYINCREHLKVLFLWCKRAEYPLRIRSEGLEIEDEAYSAMISKKILPAKAFSRGFGALWFPEDYVEDDEHNPERGQLPAVISHYNQYIARYFDERDWKIQKDEETGT